MNRWLEKAREREREIARHCCKVLRKNLDVISWFFVGRAPFTHAAKLSGLLEFLAPEGFWRRRYCRTNIL